MSSRKRSYFSKLTATDVAEEVELRISYILI